MPARPAHLPNTRERSALQLLSSGRGLSLAKLYIAGRKTIQGLIAKGWVASDENGLEATYRITDAGLGALQEKLPI
jgi:hypothetical protein